MSPSGKGQNRRRREREPYSDELHATNPLMEKESGQQKSRGRVRAITVTMASSPLGPRAGNSVRRASRPPAATASPRKRTRRRPPSPVRTSQMMRAITTRIENHRRSRGQSRVTGAEPGHSNKHR